MPERPALRPQTDNELNLPSTTEMQFHFYTAWLAAWCTFCGSFVKPTTFSAGVFRQKKVTMTRTSLNSSPNSRDCIIPHQSMKRSLSQFSINTIGRLGFKMIFMELNDIEFEQLCSCAFALYVSLITRLVTVVWSVHILKKTLRLPFLLSTMSENDNFLSIILSMCAFSDQLFKTLSLLCPTSLIHLHKASFSLLVRRLEHVSIPHFHESCRNEHSTIWNSLLFSFRADQRASQHLQDNSGD